MQSIDKNEIKKLRRLVMEKDFSRMNDMQRQAVFATEGPLLVLAGAGSGKTTVLVNRIANIIRYGRAYDSDFINANLTDADIEDCKRFIEGEELSDSVRFLLADYPSPAWKVMAITFTNKAAGELKDRLINMLGEEGEQIWASTFHSSCARILRRDAERLGYTPHFTIYDADDQRRVMKAVLRDLDISEKTMPPRAVLSEISRAKDSLRTPDIYESEAAEDFRLKMIARAYRAYQRKLEESDAMDFDDLIANTVKLFKACPDILEYYQDRFNYIMVDEYQDTNHAQYEFVNLLAAKKKNLCVVGDDDQSIYKFRGATIENIMNFEHDYPGAQVIRLEQNYRSTQNILDAANAVISNNTERKGKSLWTGNGEGKMISYHLAENEVDEADKISRIILDGVGGGAKFSDYAVLYRMNAQSQNFERMFAKQGIPHRIIGGTRFYERQEIRDMIAYLSVVNNPADEIRMRRIINRPKRGLGDKSVDTAFQIAEQVGETFMEVISHAEDFPALSRAAAKLKAFGEMISRFIRMNESDDFTMNELYQEIIDETDYIEFLQADDPERAQDRTENVEELSSNIQRYEENEGATLSGFLEEIALFTDIDNYDEGADTVVLMTVHSAKGLEFPVVFLPGWEEGVFPGTAVIYNPAEVEEERRLAYVAITRAMKELFVSGAESRMIFGSTARNRASRFIDEIPEELLERTRSREYNIRKGVMPDFSSSEHENYQNNIYKPKPSVPAPAGTFKAGDTVEHKTFGTGLILTAAPMANDTLLEIAFDKVGTKKLFANFARLTKN